MKTIVISLGLVLLVSPVYACNFYSWTPVVECVQAYHAENDPMTNGSPNPHAWNAQLAAEGRRLADAHPEVALTTAPTTHEGSDDENEDVLASQSFC